MEAIGTGMRVVTALGRAAVVVASTLLALTLLAGIVGALLRFTVHGLVGGHGVAAFGAETMGGVGFVLGFGIGLPTVIAWAGLVVLPIGIGYLAYHAVRAEPAEIGSNPAN
jgi:hypothetical protein